MWIVMFDEEKYITYLSHRILWHFNLHFSDSLKTISWGHVSSLWKPMKPRKKLWNIKHVKFTYCELSSIQQVFIEHLLCMKQIFYKVLEIKLWTRPSKVLIFIGVAFILEQQTIKITNKINRLWSAIKKKMSSPRGLVMIRWAINGSLRGTIQAKT